MRCPPTIRRGESLPSNGAILLARNTAAAVRFANRFAPEHLSIPGGEAALVRQLHAAGSVFVGPWSAQSVGDYASGTNHVLANGWRRALARRAFDLGFRALLERAAAFARGIAAAWRRWFRRWRMLKDLVAHRRAVEVRE